MKILVIYASYSGSTQMAAETVTEKLKESGNSVEQKTAGEVNLNDIVNFDLVIFGSPSWDYNGLEGQPHEDFAKLAESNKDFSFANKPCAVFGLGDSSYMHFCGAVDYLDDFVKKHNGKLIADSLKIDGYFMDQDKHTKDLQAWTEKVLQVCSS